MAVTVTGLLALPTAALAYAPSAGAFVTCTPDIVAIGDQISCEAGVFIENTTVTVTIDSGDPLTPDRASAVTTVIADANGQAPFTFRATESGRVRVSLSGTRGNGTRDGETFYSSTTLLVSGISADVLGVSLDATDALGVSLDTTDVLGVSLAATDVLGVSLDATDGASLGALGDEDAELSNTGADAGVLAVVAVGAISIGGGALASSRRRRTSATA